MKHLKKKKTSYILKGVGSFHRVGFRFSCNKRSIRSYNDNEEYWLPFV